MITTITNNNNQLVKPYPTKQDRQYIIYKIL